MLLDVELNFIISKMCFLTVFRYLLQHNSVLFVLRRKNTQYNSLKLLVRIKFVGSRDS